MSVSPSPLTWPTRVLLVLLLPTWVGGVWQALSRPNDMLTNNPDQAVEWAWWKIAPRPDPFARYEPLRGLLADVARADYLIEGPPAADGSASSPAGPPSAASVGQLFVARYALSPTLLEPVSSLDQLPSRLTNHDPYYLVWDRPQSHTALDELARMTRITAEGEGLDVEVLRFPLGLAVIVVRAP